MSKPNYTSVYDHYSAKMMKLSLSVGVVWAMSSICLSIILVMVFIQDQWIGDTPSSKGPGNFGLWRWCSDKGDLGMFSTILSPAFRAGTVFTGLAVVVTVLAMMVWLAICFTSTISLFKFSGILQLVAGMFMVIVILSYPAGWDNSSVVSVCGPQADDFILGTCDIRWSYMLAVIGCCDALLLGTLALTLGYKQIIPEDDDEDTRELGPPPGYLINNMEIIPHEMKQNQQLGVIAPDRMSAGVSRDSLYSQNNFLL